MNEEKNNQNCIVLLGFFLYIDVLFVGFDFELMNHNFEDEYCICGKKLF